MRETLCADMEARLTDYLEGALSAGDRARFDAHLSACRDCGAHLRDLRTVLLLLSGLPAEPISPDLESSLITMYREWTEAVGF